jgi:glucosamine 6-phosphate synthetase-like amidotransferase/phosphosugar isomerase protein
VCGLAGMMNPDGFIENDFRFFKELLKVSCVRGFESTGVLSYEKETNQYEVRKECIPSPGFVDKNGYKFLKNNKATLYMGHTRWSTTGANRQSNAHPFDTEKYIGAHNGTLRDWEYNKDFSKTDSEQMFEDMDKKGIREVLDSLAYYSAFAVSIFEKKSRVMYFARNDDRPLFFGVHPTRKLFVWASDVDFITFAQKRANLADLELYEVSAFNLFRIDPEKIEPGKKCWTTTTIKQPKKPKGKRLDDYEGYGAWWEETAYSTLYDSKGNLLSSSKPTMTSEVKKETMTEQENRLLDEYLIDKQAFALKYPNLIDNFGNLSMSSIRTFNDPLPF